MKHISLTVLALALVMAGCSRTDDMEQTRQAVIAFNGYFSTPTKAVQKDVSTSNPLESFMVSALKNGTASDFYFKNVEFTKGQGSTAYNSTDKFYWPNFNLSFAAYSQPSTANTTVVPSADGTAIAITVSNDIAYQEDIVAAYLSSQEYNGTLGNETKTFTFNHCLTQIIFKAKNSNSHYTVTVDGAKIANLARQGSFIFSSNSMNPASGTVNTSSSTDFSVTRTPAIELKNTIAGDTVSGAGGKWYLIPQQVTRWDGSAASGNATYFALHVNIVSDGGVTVYKGWTAVTVPDALLMNSSTTTCQFAAGKKYTFTFDFFSATGGGAGRQDPETAPTEGPVPGAGKEIVKTGKAITFETVYSDITETQIDIKL